jgi:hypothetical protein
MSESIESWLKHEAGVNSKILSFEKEFSNGYYFGEIFYTYGMNPKFVEHFHNKFQGPYVVRNFYYLPPLFKKIRVQFNEDIQNSLQAKELGFAKQLIFKMRDAFNGLNMTPAIFETRVGMTVGEYSIEARAREKCMPEKSIFLEKKLVKFENEFLKQKDEMLTRKRLDDDKYSQIIQSKRKDH